MRHAGDATQPAVSDLLWVTLWRILPCNKEKDVVPVNTGHIEGKASWMNIRIFRLGSHCREVCHHQTTPSRKQR